jgi:hypothetical protein
MESFRVFLEVDAPTVIHAQSQAQSSHNALQQLSRSISLLHPNMGDQEVSGSPGYIPPEQTGRARKNYDLSHPDNITHLARAFQTDPTLSPILNDLSKSFRQVLQAYERLQQGAETSFSTEATASDRLGKLTQVNPKANQLNNRLDKHMEPVYRDTPQDRKQRSSVIIDRIGKIDNGIEDLKDSVSGLIPSPTTKQFGNIFNQFYTKWRQNLPGILKYLGSAQQSAYAGLRNRQG